MWFCPSCPTPGATLQTNTRPWSTTMCLLRTTTRWEVLTLPFKQPNRTNSARTRNLSWKLLQLKPIPPWLTRSKPTSAKGTKTSKPSTSTTLPWPTPILRALKSCKLNSLLWPHRFWHFWYRVRQDVNLLKNRVRMLQLEHDRAQKKIDETTSKAVKLEQLKTQND